MGQEINNSHFKKHDFHVFKSRLREETALVKRWFDEQSFAVTPTNIAGLELEAWLVDNQLQPAPINKIFLDRLNNPLVVPELSVFNVEFNVNPVALHGDALSRLHTALEQVLTSSNQTAAELDSSLLMIGILPTVKEQDLNIENMSRMTRYHALNEQILRQRHGHPLVFDLCGEECVHIEQQNVMLEAATTSLQIHLQLNPNKATQYFNSALILSAPMVAIATNSPFLFGHCLWKETRIRLFEQAVAVNVEGGKPRLPNVTFGTGYVKQSLFELFVENLESYSPLLPMILDEPLESVNHLRLHNGTIWRWNRPLIGFEADGTPHLRLEHRVMAAGPTVIDSIANMALFYGLIHMYGEQQQSPAAKLPFELCKENFYNAARDGLSAKIHWLNGKTVELQQLLVEELLPLAKRGLEQLEINRDDIQTYLGIIEARIRTGRTGADWQLDFVTRNGHDMNNLTRAYSKRQQQGEPVHEWNLTC
jgi:gamma-glutamyl:cysteine ligase YbdK (ATP-grasp superfamily)